MSDAAGSVLRFGEEVISVPVSISALRALRSAAAIAGSNPEKVNYELKGKLAGPMFKSVRFTSQRRSGRCRRTCTGRAIRA